MQNCILLHTPKCGGTTFINSFKGFKRLSTADKILKISDEALGQLIEIHTPAIGLYQICGKLDISFEKLISNSKIILLARDPVGWIESYWNFIIWKKSRHAHLLFQEHLRVGSINCTNLLDFDHCSKKICGYSLSEYVETYSGMNFKHFKKYHDFMHRHILEVKFNNDYLKKYLCSNFLHSIDSTFTICPFVNYSFLNYTVESYIWGTYNHTNNSNLASKLDILTLPVSRLSHFLHLSKQEKNKSLFIHNDIESLFNSSRKDIPSGEKFNKSKSSKPAILDKNAEITVRRNMYLDLELNHKSINDYQSRFE